MPKIIIWHMKKNNEIRKYIEQQKTAN